MPQHWSQLLPKYRLQPSFSVFLIFGKDKEEVEFKISKVKKVSVTK
jgi:hypothetical protein